MSSLLRPLDDVLHGKDDGSPDQRWGLIGSAIPELAVGGANAAYVKSVFPAVASEAHDSPDIAKAMRDVAAKHGAWVVPSTVSDAALFRRLS